MRAALAPKVVPHLAMWNASGTPWLVGTDNEREINASRVLRQLRAATSRPGTELTGSGYLSHTAKIFIKNKFDGGVGFDCVVATMPSEAARAAILTPASQLPPQAIHAGFPQAAPVHCVTVAVGQLRDGIEQKPALLQVMFVAKELFFRTGRALTSSWEEGTVDGLLHGLLYPSLVPVVAQDDSDVSQAYRLQLANQITRAADKLGSVIEVSKMGLQYTQEETMQGLVGFVAGKPEEIRNLPYQMKLWTGGYVEVDGVVAPEMIVCELNWFLAVKQENQHRCAMTYAPTCLWPRRGGGRRWIMCCVCARWRTRDGGKCRSPFGDVAR